MANALANLFTDIADSIRSKTGSTEKLSPSEFPSQIDSIQGGGGGIPTGYHSVTFMNGNTELLTRPVYIGDDCPDPVTQGRIETPTKESTPQYNYTHSGWTSADGGTANSSILKNITEDKVVYSAYTESVRTYTITFYDGTTLLHTEQVAYGGTATYTPPKKDGFMFMGWTPEPTNVTSDLECIGAWQESYAFADAPWSYIAQVSESGKASEVFALGDTRTETLNYADGTTEDVELMIASFDLYPDANEKPTITIINNNLLSKTSMFQESGSGNGGYLYRSSDTLKPFLENTVIPAFSSELQSVLREGFIEAKFMFNPDFYSKIAPLSLANVGLTYDGKAGGNSPERLYSFDGTDAKRKCDLPSDESTCYWLYNYASGTKYSKVAGAIQCTTGYYQDMMIHGKQFIRFKIFV